MSRGPSKGFNEALEIRLQETEKVLLKMLSIISPEQLSEAFSIPTADEFKSLDKKACMEDWLNFPLKSAEDVDLWFLNRQSEPRQYDSAYGNETARSIGTPLKTADQQRDPGSNSEEPQIHGAELNSSNDDSVLQIPSDFQRAYLW